MTQTRQFSKTIRNYCPYCSEPYKIQLDLELKQKGLTNTLIKPHKNCNRFLIFLDPNGAVRGSQCIDMECEEEKTGTSDNSDINMKQYVKLFEDNQNITDFYHILELEGGNLTHKGVITSKKVKYHRFLRSNFYRDWLKLFHKSDEDFSFMFSDNTFILTINLYDMLIFTAGIDIKKLDKNIKLKGMGAVIDFLKGKAVSLGEKILS